MRACSCSQLRLVVGEKIHFAKSMNMVSAINEYPRGNLSAVFALTANGRLSEPTH